jgi:FemAB-related protein (PEP-CTERM system-associated)
MSAVSSSAELPRTAPAAGSRPDARAGAARAEEELVRALGEAEDEARDAFVRAHPRGTFFHLSGWRRAVQGQFGHRPLELGTVGLGGLTGILPLCSVRGLGGGRSLVSIPYGVYGGVLGSCDDVERALVEQARAAAVRAGIARVELRQREGLACLAHLPRSDLYATFRRELPADPAGVLAAMPKKARAEARKAREKHGLVLREGLWYLDDLVRLFAANKHSLGSPSLPGAWFQRLCQEFPLCTHVHVVQRTSQPLAAVMSFAFGTELLAYYAGTAPGADREYSASNFMYMALQEWAIERGFRRFDFGRSRKDSGAHKFKEHQGFEPADLPYRYILEGRGRLPSFHPSNPRTAALRGVWTRLPAPLARALSSGLSRYLP